MDQSTRHRGRGQTRAAAVTALLLVCAWAAPWPAVAGSLVIDSRADWQEWTYAEGTLALSADGHVRPRYYRKDINACVDASEFIWVDRKQQEHVGGVRNAGSNASLAPRAIDGNPATSWGPRRQDDPEDWWLEVDLGRLVTASKVVLRFAEDADPFEEFKVYVSDGTPAFVSAAVADAPDYQAVASVTKSNREMVLEYPLRDEYNREVPHRSVRYVYVVMTAWRDPQANPELAELEVIALGDNLVARTLGRGGDISAYSGGGVAAALIDGDGTTFWESSRWSTFPEAHWYFHLDLGARFWVDTITLIAYPPGIYGTNVTPPVFHRIEVSNGTPQPGVAEGWEAKGPYVWTSVDYVSQNPPPGADRPLYVMDTEFEPRQVERIFYDHLTPQGISAGRIRVREVQAFGQGYIPSATLQSGFIDLGRASSISTVEWEAETPAGTSVKIRTRTGDEIIEEKIYYTKDGQVVRDKNNSGTSEDEYAKLPPFRKGEVVTLVKPDEGWSTWSRPYLVSGEAFLSPSPRRYLQIEAAMESSEPEAAASLDRLELTYFDPLVRRAAGEIWPAEAAQAGVSEDFSFYIRPTMETRSRGFDEILILTPSPAELVGLRVSGEAVEPDSVRQGADSLWVRLPLVRRQSDPLVEIQFNCTIYLNGTPFDAFVGHSSQPGAWQRVAAGEASGEVDSQRLVVGVPVEARLLAWAGEPPGIFTPNGDGRNDELALDVVVYKITSPRPMGLRIYDLRGAQVHGARQTGSSGRHLLTWDGRDDAGQMVAPGLYLAEVFLEGAADTALLKRVVSVAY